MAVSGCLARAGGAGDIPIFVGRTTRSLPGCAALWGRMLSVEAPARFFRPRFLRPVPFSEHGAQAGILVAACVMAMQGSFGAGMKGRGGSVRSNTKHDFVESIGHCQEMFDGLFE